MRRLRETETLGFGSLLICFPVFSVAVPKAAANKLAAEIAKYGNPPVFPAEEAGAAGASAGAAKGKAAKGKVAAKASLTIMTSLPAVAVASFGMLPLHNRWHNHPHSHRHNNQVSSR